MTRPRNCSELFKGSQILILNVLPAGRPGLPENGNCCSPNLTLYRDRLPPSNLLVSPICLQVYAVRGLKEKWLEATNPISCEKLSAGCASRARPAPERKRSFFSGLLYSGAVALYSTVHSVTRLKKKAQGRKGRTELSATTCSNGQRAVGGVQLAHNLLRFLGCLPF